MADAFFDTTFFIDVTRGTYPGANSLRQELLARRISGAFSPITAYELWGSKHFNRDEETLFKVAFRILEEAPLTAAAAQQAGEWLRGVARTTAQRRTNDALIAATAALRNEPVYTANVRHFRPFDIRTRTYR